MIHGGIMIIIDMPDNISNEIDKIRMNKYMFISSLLCWFNVNNFKCPQISEEWCNYD